MHLRLATGACVLALGAIRLAGQTPTGQPAREEQRSLNLKSFEMVWSLVRDEHWDPKLGGLNWNAIRRSTRIEVQKASSIVEVRAVLTRMLSRLGQSHFAVIPGDVYRSLDREAAEARSQPAESPAPPRPEESEQDGVVGIEPGVIGGQAVVIAVEPDSPADRAGIRPGFLLQSIAGVSMERRVTAIESAQIRERQRLQAMMLNAYLDGSLRETVQLEVIDAAGERKTLVLGRAPAKGNRIRFGFLPETHVWIEARKLPGDIGYVRFNAFLDPETLMPRFEQVVRDCFRCRGFIVDLRGNPGGIGAMAMGMAGWFLRQRGQRLGTLQTREATLDFEVNPRPRTFDGPLAILVDAASASTSEILAAGLQDLGRARVFGEPTAGAALPSTVVRLPNGDGFQYANANYTSRNGKRLEGAGVTPDVVVRRTRESLIAGRDAVVDSAVDWIHNKP